MSLVMDMKAEIDRLVKEANPEIVRRALYGRNLNLLPACFAGVKGASPTKSLTWDCWYRLFSDGLPWEMTPRTNNTTQILKRRRVIVAKDDPFVKTNNYTEGVIVYGEMELTARCNDNKQSLVTFTPARHSDIASDIGIATTEFTEYGPRVVLYCGLWRDAVNNVQVSPYRPDYEYEDD